LHAGGGGGLNAHLRVFEDEAGGGRNVKLFCGEEERLGVGLGAGIVAGADEDIEFVEEAEDLERFGDGLARGSGDDSEGDFFVGGFDLLKDFRDGGGFGQELVVKAFFTTGDFFDGHVQAVALVEGGDDFADGHASPGVEERLGEEGAAVLGESVLPGDVMKRHGVGDGAVHVKEVSAVGAGREGEAHKDRVQGAGADKSLEFRV
jgi:hypothetical protein